MSLFNSHNLQIERHQVVEVSWGDRWQVYQRLTELDIPCKCQTNQPLQVEIKSPQVAIQVWSVVRTFTSSRQNLINNIEDCWRMRYQAY